MLYKFSGAGNDFVVLDGRRADMEAFRDARRIGELCREHHTDGLMILNAAPEADFGMEFYNPDGSGGMMCGNGGRCIVAFADLLGILPADGKCYRFLAPDGLHRAKILSREADRWTVRLQMIDVKEYRPCKDGWFLNTGTRHFVRFVEDVEAVDMDSVARPLRWDADFAPEGTNVNFVQATPEGLRVRTFEKGVEGETLACGTGLTASALAAWLSGIRPAGSEVPPSASVPAASAPAASVPLSAAPAEDDRLSYRLQCRRGDWLSVDFLPDFTSVHLTGPAENVIFPAFL